MTTQDLVEMTTFKVTKRGARLVDDRGDLVSEFRATESLVPTSHHEAAAWTLIALREREVLK